MDKRAQKLRYSKALHVFTNHPHTSLPSNPRTPPLIWIDEDQPLPDPRQAWGALSTAPGLLAAGSDLSVHRLREAYAKGIFPWYNDSQPVLWWSTDPRMVLMVDQFNIHRSFKKTLAAFVKNSNCEIRMDSDFSAVIRSCALRLPTARMRAHGTPAPQSAQKGTWILPQMQGVYTQAHAQGLVHCVETWIDQELVGGLYCVALGKAVFGESMFSRRQDASKIALAALVAFCRAHGIVMIDCQQNTAHLASLGAFEIPRDLFLQRIKLSQKEESPHWRFERAFWRELSF